MLRNVLHYTNMLGLLWALCVCLFNTALLPRWLVYGGVYLFLLTWLIEFAVEKRWQARPTKEWIFFGLMLVFYFWAFLYWPWDGAHTYFGHHLEQRLSLLGFGLIGLFGLNEKYSKAALIHTMVVVSTCSVIFLVAATGLREVFLSPYRVYNLAETRIQYINAHMGYNFFLNTTLIGMWYLLFHAEHKPALWQKIVYPIAAAIIFLALLFSDGRSGFFMGMAIVGLMSVVEIYRWRKWVGVGYAVVALSAMLAVTALHPRVSSDTLSHDLRYCYWKSAAELIQERPILGYGMSRAQEEFDQVNMKYAPEEAIYYWTVLHHHYIDCHSQYIQTELEFGIPGLLLLLAIYLSPLFISWGKREWWLVAFFTLICMGQSLFDMFLTGRFNMIYCILMLMMLRIKDDYKRPSHVA